MSKKDALKKEMIKLSRNDPPTFKFPQIFSGENTNLI